MAVNAGPVLAAAPLASLQCKERDESKYELDRHSTVRDFGDGRLRNAVGKGLLFLSQRQSVGSGAGGDPKPVGIFGQR